MPKGIHDEETLALAIQVVRIGHMFIWAASLKYGIPKSMLADKVCGNMSNPVPFLGQEVEDHLKTWLMKMACIRYGQTYDTLFDKVQDIVVQLKIPTQFNQGRPSN